MKATSTSAVCRGRAAEAQKAEEACERWAFLYRNMGKHPEIQNSGANSAGHFSGSVLRVRCWLLNRLTAGGADKEPDFRIRV